MTQAKLLPTLKKRPRPSCYLPERNDPGQVVTYLKEMTQAKLLPTLKKRPRPSYYIPESNNPDQIVNYLKETTQTKSIPTLKKRPRPSFTTWKIRPSPFSIAAILSDKISLCNKTDHT